MITFDPAKRELTLKMRGLDFADAELVFSARTATVEDARFDYGEIRYRRISARTIGRCCLDAA
ncbi:hypothetical protein [Afipia carboxidovorans]|uniref:hypothetical protein n=1 Tax=Afipia carboxidovorans TaxID=40137 RepID=UPI003086EDE1|nr:hypothetical protein CRBSH125_34390 [Afipia carboxidovorans]